MAKETEEKATEKAPTQQAAAQPRVRWETANMRSAYANVFNVSGAREEFVMLFGMNQAWDVGQKELKVQLSDRIVMSPFAAKRFATLLSNVIKDYEKRYGVIEIETPR